MLLYSQTSSPISEVRGDSCSACQPARCPSRSPCTVLAYIVAVLLELLCRLLQSFHSAINFAPRCSRQRPRMERIGRSVRLHWTGSRAGWSLILSSGVEPWQLLTCVVLRTDQSDVIVFFPQSTQDWFSLAPCDYVETLYYTCYFCCICCTKGKGKRRFV